MLAMKQHDPTAIKDRASDLLRKGVRPLLFGALCAVNVSGLANRHGSELRTVGAASDTVPSGMRTNQLGYFPMAKRRVAYVGMPAGVAWAKRDLILAHGVTGGSASWAVVSWPAASPDLVYVEETGQGSPSVATNPYSEVLPAAVKSYYFQRAGLAIPGRYGGPWARAAGHPDTAILFHATSGRASTTPYASPGGWYDAGDYNKYIVNGAFAVGIMLQLAEQYPEVLPDGAIDFPEAGNGRNDLLDELKVELDWMLTMQDPADGGIHHKLTTLKFEGMVMPEEATNQRYILAKGTAATLDFAACFAQASRVYGRVGEEAFAKTCLTAAERAYAWAEEHPDEAFKNPPDVSTGEYGDRDFRDEWTWAAMELFLTTGELGYWRPFFNVRKNLRFNAGESWNGQMTNLAVYSYLNAEIPSAIGYQLAREDQLLDRRRLLSLADSLMAVADTSAFHQPINDWHWGSTSDVLGAAMVTANAYRLTKDTKYLAATREWTDWVFGYNATGHCYVTGFGESPPMNIHHRPSAADGVAAPVPGFIVGGPNTYQQDTSNGVVYPVPPGVRGMSSYADQEGSYASNEVCLNWNAPLVYVLGFLQATKAE